MDVNHYTSPISIFVFISPSFSHPKGPQISTHLYLHILLHIVINLTSSYLLSLRLPSSLHRYSHTVGHLKFSHPKGPNISHYFAPIRVHHLSFVLTPKGLESLLICISTFSCILSYISHLHASCPYKFHHLLHICIL